MVARQSVCLRRLAGGARGGIVGFGRFLANPKVTSEAVIEGWSASLSQACQGRHVLAIQDTSEINFATTAERDRGLGKIGKGVGRGVLLHPMLAVDAASGSFLGLATGRVWTRHGLVATPHAKRSLSEKESERWICTPEAAKAHLGKAAMVTEVSDREADIYAKWARVAGPGFHVLTRAMHDRKITEGGGKLSSAPLTAGGTVSLELRQQPGRPAREARVAIRYGRVTLKRPPNTIEKDLPKALSVSLIEVVEIAAPRTVAKPIVWRLLTTHPVEDAAQAWRIVGWYQMRWIIEQFFRTLKQQGLQLEGSQIETADRLLKLTAIAAKAAAVIMQLVQARDGRSEQSAEIAFTQAEIEALAALVPKLEGKTDLQKNHHPPGSLAWAAWAIAKLGGWDGYPKSKPPGPITFRHGLQYFRSLAHGWSLRDV
ncbi:MAG: IS4 family transposase [Caulobacteraceae bacterium]